MNFLGIGPLEIVLVCIVALLVLGPEGMVSGARKMGNLFLRWSASELGKNLSNSQELFGNLVRDFKTDVGLDEYRAYIESLDLPKNQDFDLSPGISPAREKYQKGPQQPQEEVQLREEIPAELPQPEDHTAADLEEVSR